MTTHTVRRSWLKCIGRCALSWWKNANRQAIYQKFTKFDFKNGDLYFKKEGLFLIKIFIVNCRNQPALYCAVVIPNSQGLCLWHGSYFREPRQRTKVKSHYFWWWQCGVLHHIPGNWRHLFFLPFSLSAKIRSHIIGTSDTIYFGTPSYLYFKWASATPYNLTILIRQLECWYYPCHHWISRGFIFSHDVTWFRICMFWWFESYDETIVIFQDLDNVYKTTNIDKTTHI